MAISYHIEENLNFKFRNRRLTSRWIRHVCETEGREIGAIAVVFCSEKELLGINRTYLGHDYATDIITFDHSGPEKMTIAGDLMVGVGTVRDNAQKYGVSFEEELMRVIIHGILHLCGYGDLVEQEQEVMRQKENDYLKLRETDEI